MHISDTPKNVSFWFFFFFFRAVTFINTVHICSLIHVYLIHTIVHACKETIHNDNVLGFFRCYNREVFYMDQNMLIMNILAYIQFAFTVLITYAFIDLSLFLTIIFSNLLKCLESNPSFKLWSCY